MNDDEIAVGALFAGIGGIELGLERTGYFETEWFVEKAEFPQRVLKKHWPETPIYGDIRDIDFTDLTTVDMLTGGFPCQDISRAGPGGGVEDGKRSGLWSEYARAIREIRPRIALIENVSAITDRGLDAVIADLAQAGYDAEWFDLRARDVGALHKRERLFIIAYRDDDRCRLRCENAPRTGQGSIEEGMEPESEHRERGSVPRPAFTADNLGNGIQRVREVEAQEQRGLSQFQDVERVADLRGRSDLPQPLVRGGSDGIPDRVDRTKAIGNAVVPQCAEAIGYMIADNIIEV